MRTASSVGILTERHAQRFALTPLGEALRTAGKVRFTLADGARSLSAGDVLHLRGHAPHGAEALEDSVVLDVFAPPSATTGIDRD